MPPALRKFVVLVHIVTATGWLGAVFVFLALAVIGFTSQDVQTVRGVYLVMAPAAKATLVPLAFCSLLVGTILGLGTRWGLIRHYWVIFKLGITAVATFGLLEFTQTFNALARLAADPGADLLAVRDPSTVGRAIAATVLLLLTTLLAVVKPRGMTKYGQRRQRERSRPTGTSSAIAADR